MRQVLRFLMRHKVLLLLTVSAGCLLLAEASLRLMGFQPFAPRPINILVEPGGRYYQKDPTLGYRHLPGHYAITLPNPRPDAPRDDKLVFHTTHGNDTLRITRSVGEATPSRQGIWIFGGSFTHGWALNDAQTYPWLLQQRFPDYDVRNFGVNGYGTLQNLLQFEQQLQAETPGVVVVAYASFHDPRNTYLRQRQKRVVPYNALGNLEQPYARLDDNDKLVIQRQPVRYREFPGMRFSAFVHKLESLYNRLEATSARSHDVTRAVLMRFQQHCKSNNIQFVVATLTADRLSKDMLQFCRDQGMHAVDISVDTRQPGMSNRPYDSHPSAKASQMYAQKLGDYLAELISKNRTGSPKSWSSPPVAIPRSASAHQPLRIKTAYR